MGLSRSVKQMKTIYINPKHSLFIDQLAEAFTHNKTVVCSQRPLNGDITFEYDSIGYGRYFAVGDINQYINNWSFLDTALIQLRTNEDVIELIKKEVYQEGLQLQELLEEVAIGDIAESLGYMYID
jgi:hypothetical protein